MGSSNKFVLPEIAVHAAHGFSSTVDALLIQQIAKVHDLSAFSQVQLASDTATNTNLPPKPVIGPELA
jgi:hypothetical protein